ncbi:MAG: DUF3524 domain-containing protein [Bradymonadaceae bacterium]
MKNRRLLLLSAYDAQSHRYWREGLVRHFDEYHWTVLTQPPRHFRWRSRGNSLYWAFDEREVLSRSYDGLIATSMVDLATLRGLVPSLAGIPTAVYFHENQFVYPTRSAKNPKDLNFALTNLYTALSADRIVFNSTFNRDTFLTGGRDFLRLMPDQIPAGVIESLEERVSVLPVPLELTCFKARSKAPTGSLNILWNHRWEYDKAPERFFGALFELAGRERPFRLHVVGQSFREKPPIFEEARLRLASHIDTWGYLPERKDYEELLSRCDVVVSTALHEFQGLSMLEAVAMGCQPLAPRRLAYPEYFPDDSLFSSHPDHPLAEQAALVSAIDYWIDDVEKLRRKSLPDLSFLSWPSLNSKYDRILTELIDLS